MRYTFMVSLLVIGLACGSQSDSESRVEPSPVVEQQDEPLEETESEEDRILRERAEAGLAGPIPEHLRRLMELREARSTPGPSPVVERLKEATPSVNNDELIEQLDAILSYRPPLNQSLSPRVLTLSRLKMLKDFRQTASVIEREQADRVFYLELELRQLELELSWTFRTEYFGAFDAIRR